MKSQKERFSLRPNVHYLNCAYKAPLMKSAEEACIQALIRERNPSDLNADDFFDQVQQIRVHFAQLIKANPSCIALMPSTSYGFGSVLQNVRAKKGGNAVIVKDEFPSGYFSLESWCKKNGQNLTIVAADNENKRNESWDQNIIRSINPDTSVVLISTIHWMHGFRFDLETIGKRCEEMDAVFIIDGTQSVGALPMDINRFKIDALICASYKWLLGPYSMALAYIGERFGHGVPLEESWMNRSNAKNFESLGDYDSNYAPGSMRYNTGETSNLILAPILLESIKQVSRWKPENIQEYCKSLGAPLEDYLNQSGVGTTNKKETAEHIFALTLHAVEDQGLLKNELMNHGVFVSVRGENIRVSINVFNDSEDITQLIEVIQKII